MMCVSKGAPDRPGKQTERQQGMQELWNFLYSRNAVFLGDPGLKEDLDRFLKANKVKRSKETRKQKEYTGLIERPIEAIALLREGKAFMEKALKLMEEDKACV
jgi:hypothetical protein